MHILITVNAAWNVWNFRRALVRALIDDGHRVTVLAPVDDSVADIRGLGCRFLPLDMSVKGLNPLEDVRLMQRFKRIFVAERPDAILSFTIKNNIFGGVAAGSLGILFIPNVTGLGTAFLSGGLLQKVAEWLYRRGFRKPSVIFFQNENDRDLFVERGLVRPAQAHLLPGSGIDLTRFAAMPYPSGTEAPIFLMIGRLLRDKGVIEFVDAARQIKSRVPQARFQLLGAVAAENRTAIDIATVKEWVAAGVIEYLETTADVRPFISAAHCVVLPSYREGAPRTLIEAAAMARPLIATDVPGCRSVLDDGRNGFLCHVRSADSLADAVQRFLDLPHGARAAMGQAGRAKMEREFNEVLVVNAYRDALSQWTRTSDR